MKTTISIPDEKLKQTDALAKRLNLSRSALLLAALEEFLHKRNETEITRQLDRVYSDNPSQLDSIVNEMQLRSLPKEDW